MFLFSRCEEKGMPRLVVMRHYAIESSGAECGKSYLIRDKLAGQWPVLQNSRFWHHFS
jgi:hypothetical protein